MNNQENNARTIWKRALPYFITFLKFATGFVVIVAVALLFLSVVNVRPWLYEGRGL